jgi:hypothetical protein
MKVKICIAIAALTVIAIDLCLLIGSPSYGGTVIHTSGRF